MKYTTIIVEYVNGTVIEEKADLETIFIENNVLRFNRYSNPRPIVNFGKIDLNNKNIKTVKIKEN